MAQLVDGFLNVGQRGVGLLLLEGAHQLGAPAPRQFLEGAHVEVAVMEIGFQLGHAPGHETAILANGVAAHRRLASGHVFFEESDDRLAGLRFVHRAGAHPVGEAGFAVGVLVPGVHAGQHRIALMDGQHRPFHAHGELRVGHDHGHFDDAIGVGIQPRHLHVDPDEVVVVTGEDGSGRRGGIGHEMHSSRGMAAAGREDRPGGII